MEELVKELRFCAATESSCSECKRFETIMCEVSLHTEAADAIEKLQGQIDGWIEQERKALLKSVPKWIPVTEALPDAEPGDVSERVLVTDGKDVAIVEWFNFEDCGQFWGYTGFGKDVTHWMPLPEPPKFFIGRKSK